MKPGPTARAITDLTRQVRYLTLTNFILSAINMGSLILIWLLFIRLS